MSSDVIKIGREGNPNYPLPSDYNTLTKDGQRQARVNASRQWLLPGTDAERGENRVASTHFFDTYYLHPDPEADFDPLFYDMTPLPTPSMHWDLSRMWASNRLNVAMAPRGSAKSTHCRKDMILCLVTTPFSFVYATSTHDNSKHTGQLIKDQCYYNTRIIEDFGSLKPARGNKPTGVEYFFLTNSSWLRCVSAESRLRGMRPRRFRLDDPEYDEKATTSMATIRQYMDRLLFKIAMQMVMRSQCGIDWVGTFVSRLHYLWHAMQTVQTPQGLSAADPRFNYWARMMIRAAYLDEQGNTHSCWPHMWPKDNDERLDLGLASDTVTLVEMKEMMGISSFNGEMLGLPGTSDEQFFKLDPSATGRHAYWYEEVDALFLTNPWASSTLICWKKQSGEVTRVPLREWLPTVKLFMTVDTAFTENTHSDRRCCNLMAVTRDNELFVLDLWSDRKGDDVLLKKSFEIAQLWKCPTIYVEVIKESYKLYKRYQSVVQTKMIYEMGFHHIPGVKDIRPGQMSKTSKISTLDLRFEHGLIKLPIYRRNEKPWWSRLFEQIEGFNPEADNGGLEKDEEIDTTSMSLFVIRGKMRQLLKESAKPIDPLEEIKKGNFVMAGGASYGMGLPLDLIDPETIGFLMSQQADKERAAHANSRLSRI